MLFVVGCPFCAMLSSLCSVARLGCIRCSLLVARCRWSLCVVRCVCFVVYRSWLLVVVCCSLFVIVRLSLCVARCSLPLLCFASFAVACCSLREVPCVLSCCVSVACCLLCVVRCDCLIVLFVVVGCA